MTLFVLYWVFNPNGRIKTLWLKNIEMLLLRKGIDEHGHFWSLLPKSSAVFTAFHKAFHGESSLQWNLGNFSWVKHDRLYLCSYIKKILTVSELLILFVHQLSSLSQLGQFKMYILPYRIGHIMKHLFASNDCCKQMKHLFSWNDNCEQSLLYQQLGR